MKGSKFVSFVLLMVFVAALGMPAAPLSAENTVVRSDEEIVTDIIAHFRHKAARNYVFNTIAVESKNGNVVLSGKVRDAYFKDRALDAAREVEGVQTITDQIEILPVSFFDDRLRSAIYRRLSNDGVLFSYFVGKDPGITIIVDRSRVTLIGTVNSPVARARAASRVRELTGVLSVDNQLKVL